VREASAAFDCDPEIVHSELLDFIRNGGKGMEQRILGAMPRDPRVDEELSDSYIDFAIGFATLDNPDIRRFCVGGGIGEEDAQRRVEMAAEIVARRSTKPSRAAPTP
jgi:hypothetical protein